MSRLQPTLHDAMRIILVRCPEHTATLQFLSEENACRDLYKQAQGDGAHPKPEQFLLRTLQYPNLFEMLPGDRVRYVGPLQESDFDMLDDLIVEIDPPEKRKTKCDGIKEKHLPEAAVMLAYGMHLLRTIPDLETVELHPDGEHGKRFDIKRWLIDHGFVHTESHGSTTYGGVYNRDRQRIVVKSIPGKGDVVADTAAVSILAECKGGIINTRHPGQGSRLRRGLCEAVGLLMTVPKKGRQIAVVPHTEVTLQLAHRLSTRAKEAGIEIALVGEKGQVTEIQS